MRAGSNGIDIGNLLDRFQDRAARAGLYARAWEPYVWPVSGVGDLKVAPSTCWRQRERFGSIRITFGIWVSQTAWALRAKLLSSLPAGRL